MCVSPQNRGILVVGGPKYLVTARENISSNRKEPASPLEPKQLSFRGNMMSKKRRITPRFRRSSNGQFAGSYAGITPPPANATPERPRQVPPLPLPVRDRIAAAARDIEIPHDVLARDFHNWQHNLTDSDFEQVESPDPRFAYTCSSLNVPHDPDLNRALKRLGYEHYLAQRFPVFVYGTLRQGQGNSSLMDPAVANVHAATLRGAAIYGADAPFPYAVENSTPNAIVVGELVDLSADTEGRFARHRLDNLEGFDSMFPSDSHYERVQVEVDIDGEPRTAWTYLARGLARERLTTMQPIPHGDWVLARSKR
jgi:gamma-glutamylcyclotransferase (GGCT)/AIG2-like uncharacterized protein YtfP